MATDGYPGETKMSKPMLAASVKYTDDLEYPLLCTPKLDGIRCLIQNGQAVSRSLKPIRNRYIQSTLGKPRFEGLDGELMLKEEASFQEVTSAIMSTDGEPDFHFVVFDRWDLRTGYEDRVNTLLRTTWPDFIEILEPEKVNDKNEFASLAAAFLEEGFEGIIARRATGKYKHGRSTIREQGLLKWKPVLDSEAEVLDYYEEMHNENEAMTNALGRTERSTAKDGLKGKGRLGGFVLRDLKSGVEFRCGSGLDEQQRIEFWQLGGRLRGRTVKYKYQSEGAKDKPRFPIFLGFRDPEDM